jgi:hypothetical protein
MPTITVISSDIAQNIDTTDYFEELPMVKAEVAVNGGVAAIPPTCFDFEDWVHLNDDEWLMLPYTVRNATAVIDSLDECNPPDLQARWTLYKSLQRIREAADALETHIARNGLWISKDERFDCESREMPIVHIDDHKAG